MRVERLVAKSKDSYPYGPFLINLIIAIAEMTGHPKLDALRKLDRQTGKARHDWPPIFISASSNGQFGVDMYRFVKIRNRGFQFFMPVSKMRNCGLEHNSVSD